MEYEVVLNKLRSCTLILQDHSQHSIDSQLHVPVSTLEKSNSSKSITSAKERYKYVALEFVRRPFATTNVTCIYY